MTGRPALSDEDVAAFRARACDAAIALFAKHDDVSLRQLATALGCSHATPYRYFENKEELFMAVRAECYQRFGAHLREQLGAHTDPFERLLVIMQSYADFARTHTSEFRLMFQLGQPRPAQYPQYHRVGVGTWSLLEEAVGQAIDAGILAGSPKDIAHMLWAGVHGLVSLSLAQRLTVGRTAEELLRPTATAICRAHAGPKWVFPTEARVTP